MLHGQLNHHASQDAKPVKLSSHELTPKTVQKSVLKDNGKLLSNEEIALLKSLNLAKGRYHRREINALLRKSNQTRWECPYSIIRGNGLRQEGDALYAIYRDSIENKPVLIGKGGTAKVKNVQNLDTGEWAALKVISHYENIAAKEHKLLQQLGKVDSLLIEKNSKKGIHKREIVMERANGVELFVLIRDRLLPTDAALLKKIAVNILKQLKEFHDKGILLRDLKHENIMVDPETGEVALIDVGLAIAAKEGIASDGERCGTTQYVPPEILFNIQNSTYTIASDTYAAGVVLKGLLTGDVLLHKLEPDLSYTDSFGFYYVNDGIKRTIKQGGLTIPYVVESEIQTLYKSLMDGDPKKRPLLKDAWEIIEKYIPKDELAKDSQPVKDNKPTGSVLNTDISNPSLVDIGTQSRQLDNESFAEFLIERQQEKEKAKTQKTTAPMGLAAKRGLFGTAPMDKEFEADMHLLDEESFAMFKADTSPKKSKHISS